MTDFNFDLDQIFNDKLTSGDVCGAIDIALISADIVVQTSKERLAEIDERQSAMNKKIAEKLAKYHTL